MTKLFPDGKAISALHKSNPLLAAALYGLDTETEVGAEIAKALPQYFVANGNQRVFILDEIMKKAFCMGGWENYIDSFETVIAEEKVPHLEFANPQSHSWKWMFEDGVEGVMVWPTDLSQQDPAPGVVFEAEGQSFMVLRSNDGWMIASPNSVMLYNGYCIPEEPKRSAAEITAQHRYYSDRHKALTGRL